MRVEFVEPPVKDRNPAYPIISVKLAVRRPETCPWKPRPDKVPAKSSAMCYSSPALKYRGCVVRWLGLVI